VMFEVDIECVCNHQISIVIKRPVQLPSDNLPSQIRVVNLSQV
jgi:hypothetical protein